MHASANGEDPKNDEKGYYHIHARTEREGVHTIHSNSYLCGLEISKNYKSRLTDFMSMENLKYANGENTGFIEKVCPICREILEKRFPKEKAPPK